MEGRSCLQMEAEILAREKDIQKLLFTSSMTFAVVIALELFDLIRA